jgi:hypothetical protein
MGNLAGVLEIVLSVATFTIWYVSKVTTNYFYTADADDIIHQYDIVGGTGS